MFMYAWRKQMDRLKGYQYLFLGRVGIVESKKDLCLSFTV